MPKTQVKTGDVLLETIEALQHRAIAAALRGDSVIAPINPKYLVSDGRRRSAVVRALVSQGYIKPTQGKAAWKTTTLPFDSINWSEPNLIQLGLQKTRIDGEPVVHTDWDLDRRPGVPWRKLSLGEQKWVIQHPDEYKMFTFNDAWPAAERKFYPIGKVKDLASGNLYVSDTAYEEELARLYYDLEFKEAWEGNLAWGLETQKFLEEVDADAFKQRGKDPHPFGGGRAYFGRNPNKWEEDLEKAIEGNREKIATLERHTNVLLKVKNRIAMRDGWETFLKKYEEAIHNALKSEKRAEARKKKTCSG